MSQLKQLKGQLAVFEATAKKTGASIATFGPSLGNLAKKITEQIGASATSADQKMLQSLDQASSAVVASANAMQDAAKAVSELKESL